MLKFGDIMDIAVSGLGAQRARLAATASNLANAETTRTAEGGPYRRRDPVFGASPVGGAFSSQLDRAFKRVDVDRVAIDQREPRASYEPGHPDADGAGYVRRPRIDVVVELTNMMSASRSFDANLLVIRRVRTMAQAAMQIGRG